MRAKLKRNLKQDFFRFLSAPKKCIVDLYTSVIAIVKYFIVFKTREEMSETLVKQKLHAWLSLEISLIMRTSHFQNTISKNGCKH